MEYFDNYMPEYGMYQGQLIYDLYFDEINKNNKMSSNKDLEIALQTLIETKDRLNNTVDELEDTLTEIDNLKFGIYIGKLLSSMQINLIDLDDNINEVKKYVGED